MLLVFRIRRFSVVIWQEVHRSVHFVKSNTMSADLVPVQMMCYVAVYLC